MMTSDSTSPPRTDNQPTIVCDECGAVARLAHDYWFDAAELQPLLPEGWMADHEPYMSSVGGTICIIALCPQCAK